jgi:hypothetical protein
VLDELNEIDKETTLVLDKLRELTEEQTEHYRNFVKAAVDAKLHQGAADSVTRR